MQNALQLAALVCLIRAASGLSLPSCANGPCQAVGTINYQCNTNDNTSCTGASDCDFPGFECIGGNCIYVDVAATVATLDTGATTVASAASSTDASSATSVSGACVDLAAAGRPSDCPQMASYCNNALYRQLMAQQCPKTCGYCTPSSGSGSSTTCVDLAAAGRPSDCPQMASYCNNALYRQLMAQQCPKTCGLC